MNPFYHEYDEDKEYFELLERKTTRGVLKSAHIADLHFTVKNIEPKTHYEILKEQFINKIADIPLDIVSIDGDIFEKKYMSNTDSIMYASLFIADLIRVCKEKNITLIIIKGTDGHEADQLRLFYHYLNDSDIDIRIVETIRFEYVKGARILCIPELYGVEEEIYAEYLFNSGWYDMCFMHGTFEGAVRNNNVGQGRLFKMDDFMYCMGPIISGHVHTGGCFQRHFYYTGSPLRYEHGEENTKGFLIVLYDMDTRKYLIHLEEIVSFKYKTLSIDDILQCDPDQIIKYINDLKEKENIDFLRIDINTEVDKGVLDILRNFYRNDNNISFKVDTRKRIEREQALKDEQIAEQYSYILDPTMTEYMKLARYINDNMGYIYISADEIIDILREK